VTVPSEREFSYRSTGVLVASVVGVSLAPSVLIFNTFALFMQPLQNEFVWNRTKISSLVTILALAVALGSPTKGYLFDRWGIRPLILPLTLILGVVTAALALAHGDSMLIYLLFCVIGLLTPGNVPFGKIVAEWFHRKRGVAYGILGFGYVISAPAAQQLARYLIDKVGWRNTFAFYGGLEILVALPLLFFLLRNPAKGSQAGASPAETTAAHALPGATLSEAWHSREYWLVIGNLVLGLFVYVGLTTHGIAILTEKGMSREAATTALSALAIGGMLAQPLLGYLMDRFDTPRVVVPFALAAPIGLALIQTSTDYARLVAGFAIIGLGAGGEVSTTQYLVSRYFGLRYFSVIYGSIQPFILILAVGLGSYVLGFYYDKSGSYLLDFRMMDVALVAATVLLLLLGPYRFPVSAVKRHAEAAE
jgi:MFS family permease